MKLEPQSFLRAEENTLREAEAQAAVRDESALETIGGQLDTQQGQETTQRRGEVLDSILTDLGTASRANTAQRFSSALAAAGNSKHRPYCRRTTRYRQCNRCCCSYTNSNVMMFPAPPVPTRQGRGTLPKLLPKENCRPSWCGTTPKSPYPYGRKTSLGVRKE